MNVLLNKCLVKAMPVGQKKLTCRRNMPRRRQLYKRKQKKKILRQATPASSCGIRCGRPKTTLRWVAD